MRFGVVTRFFENAEQELLREAGLPYSEIFNAPDIWMPRRHLSIDYSAPARIDDPVTLVIWVSRLGETSLTLSLDVRHADGTLIAAATMVVVCVSARAFTKRPLPKIVREALAPYVCTIDEARASEIR